MRKLALLLLSLSVYPAVTNVRIVGATNTQALIGYTAPSTSACTIEASTSNTYSPLVNDVNPLLFASSDSDGGGKPGRIFTLGKNTVQTGLDGNNYSRSLQAATVHYIRITCGADTATTTVQTRNIPLGMTYVPNQPNDASTGKWKQPTSSWTNRDQEIVDPVTGALLKRTLMPRDAPDEYPYGVVHVTAGSGAEWTNPNNIAEDDGSYATYSGTSQSKLTTSVSSTVRSSFVSLDFLTLTFKGYSNGGTDADRTISLCISENGTDCSSDTKDLVLPSSAGTASYNIAGTLGDFMGWTDPSIAKIQSGTLKILVWKKSTSSGSTIYLDALYTYWAQSKIGIPTSGGFQDVCSLISSTGWTQCVINGQLYGIQVATGLVHNLGTLTFLNAAISGLIPSGGNNCTTFGDASRLWSSTNSNQIFCNATLSDGGLTLVRFDTDSTNTDKGQGIYDNWFTYSNPTIMLPSSYSLMTLLTQYEPNIPANFRCGFDTVQGNYILGACRAGQQDTYAYTFVFSLGDGTAVGSPSCGTVSNGKCQSSGTGIVAVNITFAKPICRWCTFHTLHSQGSTNVQSFEVQRTPGNLNYGNAPGIVTLNGAINATQTNITVASSWSTTPVSRTGTVSSSGNILIGSGTTFPTQTTIGDTVCAAAQCRTIVEVLYNEGAVVDSAFSPDISGASWTNAAPAQPAGFQPGDPTSTKFPRYIQPLAVGDYISIGSETLRVAAKIDNTHLTVQRGCSYFEGPCSGTGSSASDGATVSTICNAFVLDGYALAYYWNFQADPTATDTNVGDPSNSGNHAFAGIAYPNGFSGSHQTSRGQIRAMANYDVMAVPTGMANRKAWASPSNYPIPESFYFGGKYSPNGGNTYQRHPANQQSNFNTGYQYDFFTDVTPFVGGSGFVSQSSPSTLIEGTLYKVGSPDPNINPEPRPTRKYLPTMTLCGYKALNDISGPSSHIVTSTTDYTYCYAEKAGECRGGGDSGGASSAGDQYVNCPIVNTAYCTAGENYTGANDICIGNLSFDGNATVQFGVSVQPNEYTVLSEGPRRARVLAKVFDQPRQLPGTANAKPLLDGSWMLSPGISNLGNEIFLLKNPTMPALDSVNRQQFIQVPVVIPASSGSHNAYIQFGYDSNYYCTTRAEACISAASNNPYFFASETFSGVSCSSGCTINIPALPSRVLNYRIVFRDSGNNVVRMTDMYSISTP